MTTLHADVALLADGKAALLPDRPATTRDFGMQAHFTGVAGLVDTIELFGVVGHYGGIAPVEGGRWNVSFAVPVERLRTAGGDLDGLFARIVTENAALTRRLNGARRCGEWNVSPLPRFGVARDWPAGVVPIGNAAAAIEPIGGEGIGLALRSAELAAEGLLSGAFNPAALRSRYRELWTRRRLVCRAAARVISSPKWSRRAAAVADDPFVSSRVAMWLGK